jgi:hypothetical protein
LRSGHSFPQCGGTVTNKQTLHAAGSIKLFATDDFPDFNNATFGAFDFAGSSVGTLKPRGATLACTDTGAGGGGTGAGPARALARLPGGGTGGTRGCTGPLFAAVSTTREDALGTAEALATGGGGGGRSVRAFFAGGGRGGCFGPAATLSSRPAVPRGGCLGTTGGERADRSRSCEL